MARQQPGSTSHPRQRSPSPRCAPTPPGCASPASPQHPRSPPSSLCPSLIQARALRQPPGASTSSPRPSFLHGKTPSSQNVNNNNSVSLEGIPAVSNGEWSGRQTAPLANGSAAHVWPGSHNRVARPFSASEPSSRVPSPSPVSFSRLCSPPPQHNYSSPLANKPPNPRGVRLGRAASQNPLGLALELPRTSACVSPRVLSPPPIGVSSGVWTNVAAPQPRSPGLASFGAQVFENSSLPSPSVPRSGASTPRGSCSPAFRPTRSLSSSSAERPPSPARGDLRRSWAESSRGAEPRSVRASFDQHESCATSPRSGWSSYGGSPSCLSPRAGLQSPLLPSRLGLGKSPLGGQHFTSVPWPDVRELTNKYKSTDAEASAPAPVLLSPSGSHVEWGDPELEEGSCRSQLICAYIARPSGEQSVSSSCLVLSSTPQPPVPVSPRLPPVTSPFGPSSPPKPGSQKTSYATTVNLRIAGSGRITSFSTAQVSLTQTLQGGVGGLAPGPMARRVSVNGLSHLPQDCHRL